MKIFTSVTLVFLLASTAFAGEQTSYSVTYSGGSLQNVKTGEGFKMFMEQDQVRLEHGKTEPFVIPTRTITEISSGKEVHRRVGTALAVSVVTFGLGSLIALTHSKKHYIGIVWDGGEGKKGGLVIQADKNEYRGIIAALEGLTGKKAVNTDKAMEVVAE